MMCSTSSGRVGSLEIADTSDYTTDQPRVRTSVLIRDARLIPLDDVSRFLTAIGTLVSGGTGEEYAEARRNIETALTEGHETKKLKGMYVTPEVVIEASFLGSAVTYIKLRARQDKEAESRAQYANYRQSGISITRRITKLWSGK